MGVGSPSKKAAWEFPLAGILFAFLWIYLIIRANTVFYIHDEIVSKWAYMISWNPLPYHGYVDANNHFLNSLLGGLFIRLFNSDAIWIVRLPGLLAFPLYFWSIWGLRRFFSYPVNFYWLLIALSCSAFVIEYFALARGYGISLAFLLLALQQTLTCFEEGKIRHFIIALLAWILAVYANLTLIPFALAGMLYLAAFLWKKGRKKWILAELPAVLPLIYAAQYALHLRGIGKLYYGNQEGFIKTTLHSLTPYLWNTKSLWLDIFLIALSLAVLITLIVHLYRSKNLFDPRMVFPLFLMAGILNILLQNSLLGVNFPEDRAALYLIIFFFGGICFTADYWRIKQAAYPFIALTLVFFILHFNFEKSIFFYYEHFDKKLLTKIPDEVNGIPPSTGGRFWAMDNELARAENLPLRFFRNAGTPADTMEDYIISSADIRPDLPRLYHPIYQDPISKLTLFERDRFLPREKIGENSVRISGTDEFISLYTDTTGQPLFFRCQGSLEDMNIFKESILMFYDQDTATQEVDNYQDIVLTQSAAISPEGMLQFDFSFVLNGQVEAKGVNMFFWNKKKQEMKGEITLEIYDIGPGIEERPGVKSEQSNKDRSLEF